jgi:transcriptional regulator GlxA family with amidase domain
LTQWDRTRSWSTFPGANVRFVAAESGRVTDVPGRVPVDVPTRCSDVDACDVLVVPSGGGVWSLFGDQDFLGWVRRVHATTRFTTSVCSGSLLLAAAGLLDGLTAATHWGTAGEIGSRPYMANRFARGSDTC